MKTNKFEFIKIELFVSKEHYQAFRQGWKDFINSGKAKAEFHDHAYGRYKVSALTGTHHLLFNILTEKDLSRTFRPSELECKRGFWEAYGQLKMFGQKALDVVLFEKGDFKKPSYLSDGKYSELMAGNRSTIEEFLEPFGKSITVEMLAKLYLDYLKVKQLTNIPVELEVKKAA
ncbi:MAG: hypothetical protein DRI24_24005 [Deltaproteobacteria bacterium]|nr:MAG: hypothetical protein DRI24_24005 [Deltaproteobacteria bacterium]